MIKGIHHIALSTPDLDRLLKFYVELFGFEKVDWQGGWPRGSALIDKIVGLRDSSCRQAMIRAGNLYIEVFEYHSPQPKPGDPDRPVCDHGYTHFALDVTDIDQEYARLSAAGMRFHHPPVHDPESGMAATYGRDPDGNVIEIQEIWNKDHLFHPVRSELSRP